MDLVLIENLVAGVIALAVTGYLLHALLRPEGHDV